MTDNGDTKYYEFGGAWIQESQDGMDVVKKSFTSDPRKDRNAQLDSSVRIFPNGSYQTTWYDGDGRPKVGSIES